MAGNSTGKRTGTGTGNGNSNENGNKNENENKNEKEKLLAKYDKINALGVPFTIVYIMLGSLLGIFVFGLIALIV